MGATANTTRLGRLAESGSFEEKRCQTEEHRGGNLGHCRTRQVRVSREVAEGEGFEPPLGLLLSLISSQVPSTTQPPFRSFITNNLRMN
jgi:hypothetical protein